MFDVTTGRSAGIQVQAITALGHQRASAAASTATSATTSFNAADAFLNRVLPYSNSQIGGTLGGPIVQNKMHYFGSYEREREPNTAVISPAALAPQLITHADRGEEGLLPRPLRRPVRRPRITSRSAATSTSASCPTTASPPTRAAAPRRTSRRTRRTAIWSHVSARQPAAGTARRHLQVLLDLRGHADGLILTPEYQFPGPDPRPQLELSRVHPRDALPVPLRPDVERRHATT